MKIYNVKLINNERKYKVEFLEDSMLFEDVKDNSKYKINYTNIIDYNTVETKKISGKVEWIVLSAIFVFLFAFNLTWFIKLPLLVMFGFIIYLKLIGKRIQLKIFYEEIKEDEFIDKRIQYKKFKPDTYFILEYDNDEFVDEIKNRINLINRIQNKVKQYI